MPPRSRRMRPSAILVNTARGGVVDQAALHRRAAATATIAAAAIDVTDPEPPPPGDPIFATPNLIVAPHIGSATRGARARMTELVGRESARRPRRAADAASGAGLMRVAVVDIGTNSTRLLVADVQPRTARSPSSTAARASRASATASTRAAVLARRGDRARPRDARRLRGGDRGARRRGAPGGADERGPRRRERRGVRRDRRAALRPRGTRHPGAEEARLTFLGATSDRDPATARRRS